MYLFWWLPLTPASVALSDEAAGVILSDEAAGVILSDEAAGVILSEAKNLIIILQLFMRYTNEYC